MTPTPTQIADWREAASHKWLATDTARLSNHENYIEGCLHARTEQATEIAELKAKLAGAEAAALKQSLHRASFDNEAIMPLAKFGARVMRKFDTITRTDINQAALYEDIYSLKELCVRPHIEATIEQLLKD
jgi:hypothetical protein